MAIRWLGLRLVALCGLLVAGSLANAEDISYVTTNDTNLAARLDALESELASLRGAGLAGETTCGGYDAAEGCGHYIAGAELTLLLPHTGAMTLLDGGGAAVTLTPEYHLVAAPRFWLGYRNAEGLGMRARYWTLDANAGPFDPLNLVRSLHLETLDFEATQTAQIQHWDVDISAGLRWAQDRNDLLAPPGVVLTQDFQGIGGTIGLGVSRPIGSRGISLFANTRASLIYGDNNYVVGVAPQPPAVFPIATLRNSDEVVSIYEMQLGVEWGWVNASGSNWFVRTALEGQAWNIPSVALGLLDDTTGLVGASFAIGFNY